MLNLFSKKQIVHESSVPKPLFFDYHCGLAVIGQKIIKGTAFSKRTEYTDNCRYAKGVIDWLTNLAQETADYQSATSKQVAEALLCLFDQFRKIYTLPNDLLNLLNKQIESVALLDAKFPLVFQHGDAGSWNVLITESDKIAYVDWEAAEDKGMPLWDIFYFLKTYASLAAQKEGIQDSLKAFDEQFVKPTPFGSMLIKVAQQYCEALDIDPRFIEPLFYTCWMHRSLKEATRLTEGELKTGHYFNLLKRSMEAKETPTLKRLFSLDLRKVRSIS